MCSLEGRAAAIKSAGGGGGEFFSAWRFPMCCIVFAPRNPGPVRFSPKLFVSMSVFGSLGKRKERRTSRFGFRYFFGPGTCGSFVSPGHTLQVQYNQLFKSCFSFALNLVFLSLHTEHPLPSSEAFGGLPSIHFCGKVDLENENVIRVVFRGLSPFPSQVKNPCAFSKTGRSVIREGRLSVITKKKTATNDGID